METHWKRVGVSGPQTPTDAVRAIVAVTAAFSLVILAILAGLL